MQTEDMLLEDLGHTKRIAGHRRRNDVSLLAKPVHYYANGIVTIRLRQFSDEVDGDGVPWMWWCSIGMQWGSRHLSSEFYPLALVASCHIAIDIVGDLGPEVVPCDEFTGALLSWMSYCWRIVVGADDIFS